MSDSELRFAPVIIPTLNRYNHLRRCIESLERCKWADKTVVYIGLDFPPSPQYVEGWKMIDNYLLEKEKRNPFKRLVVIRRLQNCGVGKEGNNIQLLKEEVSKISDRYILSEDDNEFSPCFLDFMNKALEKYRDNKKVYKVSAYTAPAFKSLTEDTTFWGIDVSAYGLGSWIYKDKLYMLTNDQISDYLHSHFGKALKLYFAAPALMNSVAHMIVGGHNYGDIRYSICNLIRDTYVLQPSISLSRNWGADGTGVHSGIVKDMHKVAIKEENNFELNDIPNGCPKKYFIRLFFYRMPSNPVRFVVSFCYGFMYLLSFLLFCKSKK